jgi:divalent metal cation (Fe/Co/Zn/Cd) transporter
LLVGVGVEDLKAAVAVLVGLFLMLTMLLLLDKLIQYLLEQAVSEVLVEQIQAKLEKIVNLAN